MTRRELVAGVSALSLSRLMKAGTGSERYETPYKLGKLVLGPSKIDGEFDSKSVDCPFVFRHGGQFFLTYVGFDGTGYQTGLASSADLVNWKREGCILKRDASSEVTRYNVAMNWIVRENGLRTAGELLRVNGKFLGAYHAYPSAGYEEGPAVIGLCWSEDLRQWKLDAPCLRPGEAEWEHGGLYKPCLLKIGDTFHLFYNAKTAEPRAWHEQTGVAMSRDLKQWTRYAGNPIIANGTGDAWDSRFASDPCVMTDEGKWVFFYYGLDGKGKARDLLAVGERPTQARKVERILVDVGAPGSVDETYAHKPSVIWHDGALYHFYCAVSGKWPNETRGISVARSKAWS